MYENSLLVKANYGISPNAVIHNSCVLCRDIFIHAVGGKSAFTNADYSEVLEVPDSYVVPGFIDSHIYGFKGHCFSDGVDGLDKASELLVEYGVTSFLPTLKARKLDDELTGLRHISESELHNFPFAEPLGIHLVGPFISRTFKGDIRNDGVRSKVDMQELKQIVEASAGQMKIMTFAPEIQGYQELIDFLKENNIIPSMGYSGAVGDDVYEAIHRGCLRTTHLYNAMAPLHQRKPCLSSTSLVDDCISVELIVDGHHVVPQMVNLACKVKKPEKIIAISAATELAALGAGKYTFADGTECHIENKLSVSGDGKITGSTLTLDEGWRNILLFTDEKYLDAKKVNDKDVFSSDNLHKMSKAISYFTSNPALNLNLFDRGYLAPGLLADLVVLNKKHEVEATIKNGKVVYLKNKKYLNKKA